jgi:hypothetical protein
MDGEVISVASLVIPLLDDVAGIVLKECNCAALEDADIDHAATCPCSVKCICAAASGVIGHAAFCPAHYGGA